MGEFGFSIWRRDGVCFAVFGERGEGVDDHVYALSSMGVERMVGLLASCLCKKLTM